MKPCLADVNVWLSLVVTRHADRKVARDWFATLRAGDAGWNRSVQLSVMRLLSNPAVVGDAAISAHAAWRTIQDLGDDERVELVGEPSNFDRDFPALLRHPYPTNKLIGDAYLAAVAIGSSRRLVTFDKGFRQFKDLDLLLLGS